MKEIVAVSENAFLKIKLECYAIACEQYLS